MKEVLAIFPHFFQTSPISPDTISGTYDLRLVILSYLIAVIASYIALDITGRLREANTSKLTTTLWLLGGSLSMGAGIWAMHFIGMLAFDMTVPMSYDLFWTILSMVVAVAASFLALSLLKSHTITSLQLGLGGILLGISIAGMHYTGMTAMTTHVKIHYRYGLFLVSIGIAIAASEAALWLAIKSNEGTLRRKIRLKAVSALIMGLAIAGMHYTGMAAAVFTPIQGVHSMGATLIDPKILAMCIALVTFFIISIAFAVSMHKEVMNNHIMRLAHEEGMKEVATNVLHNIGNVLNSIIVGVTMINNRIVHSELAGLKDVSDALSKHENNLDVYITQDPQGSKLPAYINMLANYWLAEQTSLLQAINTINKHIQHVKDIVAAQQSFSLTKSEEQLIFLPELLEEALTITGVDFDKTMITIDKQYQPIKPFHVSKVKLLQVLINLIRNAKHSLVESKVQPKILTIKFNLDKEKIVIEVIDNGLGIPAENLPRIFTHGFTTKKTGHGFGLHASSIALKEMGGLIHVHSEGRGQGAAFTVELPYKGK